MARRRGVQPSVPEQPAPIGRVAAVVREILKWLGVLIVVGSAFFVAVAVTELAGGQSKTEPQILVGLVVFFGGTGLAGFMLARTYSRPLTRPSASAPEPARKRTPEDCVLDTARAERGRVTVEEVASHCDLSLDEAKATLDGLAARGAAEMRVTDAGILVYVFPGFLSDEDKRRAQRL